MARESIRPKIEHGVESGCGRLGVAECDGRNAEEREECHGVGHKGLPVVTSTFHSAISA